MAVSQTRRAYRARFNQLAKASRNLAQLCARDPDELAGVEIGDMRDEVEAITQSFHEFAAYWNTVHTHDDPRQAQDRRK